MIMLIRLVGTLTQIRTGKVASHSLVLGQGGIDMPSLCHNPDCFMHFRLSIIILGYSASYFLEMILPIREVGTLTRTRMRIDSLIFPDMEPMRSQYVIILSIPINIFKFFFLIFSYYFCNSTPCFLKMSMHTS